MSGLSLSVERFDGWPLATGGFEDGAHRILEPKQPSAYVSTLAMAFLLSPAEALEEDVLRALFLQHARFEGVDSVAILEAASARLRAEGLIT